MSAPMSGMAKLEALYRAQRQGLFTYALSLLGDTHQAEDVVHDVFGRLCELDIPADDLTAFVYRSVRNRAIDVLRRRRRQANWAAAQQQALSIYNAADVRPADGLLTAETVRQVQEVLTKLPDIQREVIVLHVHGDLTFDAIGRVLEMPLSTVASYYRRGLSRMRELMKGKV